MRSGFYLFVALWLLSVLPVTAVITTLWRRYVTPAECMGLTFVLCLAFIFTVAGATTAFVYSALVSGVLTSIAALTFVSGFIFSYVSNWGRFDTAVVVFYYATMIASIVVFVT